MRVGLLDYTLDISVRSYIDNVTTELEKLGVKFSRFGIGDTAPTEVDVLWDPHLTGWTPPWSSLLRTEPPVVATLHGAQPLTMAPWHYYPSVASATRGLFGVAKRIIAWQRHWRGRCAAVITVSESARRELERLRLLSGENIVVIHHGVDHETFRPEGRKLERALPYLAHVSAYQPMKNLRRSIRAMARQTGAWELLAVAPGFPAGQTRPRVEIVREMWDSERVARVLRGAMGFVFPSLGESFGLPLLEAMACGCPVITSNRGSCPEIAASAALFVDPYSIAELADAMTRVSSDSGLRQRLREAGLERAAQFSWRRSAERHLEVLESAATNGSRRKSR